MDVRLTPEQDALRDSVAQAVSRLGPKTAADLDDVERRAKLDAAVAAAGWRELRAPAEHGAPWASAVETAIIAVELGRGLADAAFIGPTLAAEIRRLAHAPSAEVPAETVALRRDLLGPGTWVAVDARGALVALALDGGRLGAVPATSDEIVVDLTRPSVRLSASGPFSPLGQELDAAALARWKALGLALTCADLVGTMRGAIDLACQYAVARRQYGVAIGSFQAVQHMLADAHVAAEGSWSVTLHAAWAVDALPPDDALAAAATAKAYCARAARSVCETAIQVYGGIGNTWECLAHVYLRRALLSTDLLGGVGPSLAIVLDHYGVEGTHGLR